MRVRLTSANRCRTISMHINTRYSGSEPKQIQDLEASRQEEYTANGK